MTHLDDCECCYGLHDLRCCGRCEAWLCQHCFWNHACEAFCAQRERLQRAVREILSGKDRSQVGCLLRTPDGAMVFRIRHP
jgi:hypothetical protein